MRHVSDPEDAAKISEEHYKMVQAKAQRRNRPMGTAVKADGKPKPLDEFRCKRCGKLLGYIKGKANIKCPRCATINETEK